MRAGAGTAELSAIVVIIYAVYFCLTHGFFGLGAPQCQNFLLQMPSEISDITNTAARPWQQLCTFAAAIEFSLAFIIPYLLICIFMISSRLKTTPACYMMGLYFTNKDAGRPSLREASIMVLGNVTVLPIILCLMYWKVSGAGYSLDAILNITYLLLAYLYVVGVYQLWSKDELTLNEKISGLRVQLSQKSYAKIKAQNSKGRAWFYILSHYCNIVFITTIAAIFIIMAFNIMRQGKAPADYEAYLYHRAPMQWQDNAYFALAGLDSPLDVEDSYAYGRERSAYEARIFSAFKSNANLPYEENIPESSLGVFDPKVIQKNEVIGFDNIGNFDCLINMRARGDATSCPAKEEVLDLISKNQILWQRFLAVADYTNFSVPDTSISEAVNNNLLINLSKMHSVYVLDLLYSGKEQRAVQEWHRFMLLYRKMISAPTNIPQKATYMGALKGKLRLLEVMLYNAPEIAITYKDEIIEAVDISGIDEFRAGYVIVDDWRSIEPLFIQSLGVNIHQRNKLYACFMENKVIADLAPSDFFKTDQTQICQNAMPKDVDILSYSFFEPGNLITNIIYNLLSAGTSKNRNFLAVMHHLVAESKMAMVAVDIINKKIHPSEISVYLEDSPKMLYNPIMQKPFSWDEKQSCLYYQNPIEDDLQNPHEYTVNINHTR